MFHKFLIYDDNNKCDFERKKVSLSIFGQSETPLYLQIGTNGTSIDAAEETSVTEWTNQSANLCAPNWHNWSHLGKSLPTTHDNHPIQPDPIQSHPQLIINNN